jgi:WD40 repeat protein
MFSSGCEIVTRANYVRIGTFFGHKGAVYQARLSPDTQYAATASADFTAYVAYLRTVAFANSF